LARVAGYVMRQFTCPKAVTHPSTNRARCRATALIETNALRYRYTKPPTGSRVFLFALIGPKSRTERPRKTKIGTEVAHITRDWDTTFKVKRSKVKVTRPLWLAVLASQHGHRVSNGSRCVYDVCRVITCRSGRGHIVGRGRGLAYSLLVLCLRSHMAYTLCNDDRCPYVRLSRA